MKLKFSSAPFSIIVDTKDNILALTPLKGKIALTSDTGYFLIGDGTNWKESGVKINTRSNKDMGIEQDSSLEGYGTDYVTDKQLSNVLIGGNVRTENGGIRIDVTQDPDTLEIFLRSAWQTIIYDLTVENNDFRHTPLSEQIHVFSGNSVSLGLNGLPIIQAYKSSMGSFPYPTQLSGGVF